MEKGSPKFLLPNLSEVAQETEYSFFLFNYVGPMMFIEHNFFELRSSDLKGDHI